jgi:spore maturation protein CgeB
LKARPDQIVLFCHSLRSDWNHGNAHFIRGITSELLARGHRVRVYEPCDSWSLLNLQTEHGHAPIQDFHRVYPGLDSLQYDSKDLDLDVALEGADLVLVHEWTDPQLVQRLGKHRSGHRSYRLLFHDTHHRAFSDRNYLRRCDLGNYDGVLAFGKVLQEIYLAEGWAQRAWVWHEAADTRVFHPIPYGEEKRDLVWIGNWGDQERTSELHEFLFEPVRSLGLRSSIYGVRYPEEVRKNLRDIGVKYEGWLPNFRVPEIFSQFRLTVHVPRSPYAKALPGIPTIRPFEALACGVPLVSAPWEDIEQLFTTGRDFLMARNGREMKEQIQMLLHDDELARALAEHGRRTILSRHTCRHRVDELLNIYAELHPQVAEEMLTP